MNHAPRVPLVMALCALVSLAACQSPLPPSAGAPGQVKLRGELTYPERIALPADSVAIVELRAFDAAGERVVAEQRTPLGGRQVPLPFELATGAAASGAVLHEFRGAIESQGRIIRVTEPVLVDLRAAALEIGELQLLPVAQVAFGTHYACAGMEVVFGALGAHPRMVVDGQAFDMEEVPAASGARYRAIGDADTWFHEKGGEALAAVSGRRLPSCEASAAPAEPFRALGQEPSWILTAGDGRVELVTQFGQHSLGLPLLNVEHAGRVTRYRAAEGEHRLVATVTRGVCRDTMSGMPHPYAVEVQTAGERLRGCGGVPLSLLTGRNWIVEDLDGGGIIDRSRISIGFSAEESRAYGLASCNRYTAGFTLTGEGLSFTHPAATMMACAPALMAQEQRFFGILQAVTSFDIDATGALILSGSGGTMKAYRDTAPIK